MPRRSNPTPSRARTPPTFTGRRRSKRRGRRPRKPAHRKHKFGGRSEKRKERLTHAGKDERRPDHSHRHKLTHTSADGQHKKGRNAATEISMSDNEFGSK